MSITTRCNGDTVVRFCAQKRRVGGVHGSFPRRNPQAKKCEIKPPQKTAISLCVMCVRARACVCACARARVCKSGCAYHTVSECVCVCTPVGVCVSVCVCVCARARACVCVYFHSHTLFGLSWYTTPSTPAPKVLSASTSFKFTMLVETSRIIYGTQ